MTVFEELTAWLEGHIPDKRKTKTRDIAIVLDFYGFGETAHPTYQEIADRRGGLTRERVRQLLDQSFRDYIQKDELPMSCHVGEILGQVRCATLEYVARQLSDQGLTGERGHVVGLLNLAKDLGYAKDRELYDYNLVPSSRHSTRRLEGLLVGQQERDRYKALILKARSLAGRHGLVMLDSLRQELGDSEDTDQLIRLIRATPEVVVVESEDRGWYIYENHSNKLINFAEKAFSLGDRYRIDRLCEMMESAQGGRTQRYAEPDADLIRKWLVTSSLFEVEGGVISMPGAERSPIGGSEGLVVDYLADGRTASYEEIIDALASSDYSRMALSKACTSSPVVYVDRSQGRKKHTYQIITHAAKPFINGEPGSRYERFKKRLQRLAVVGTDIDMQTQTRREQSELRDWILNDAGSVVCAICGENYSSQAIVAAHKKPRSECTEAERSDPHIVFPLCVFGYDYLYERAHLRIRDDEVRLARLPTANTADRARAEAVAGRTLDARWAAGPTHYFEALNPAALQD